MCRSIKTLRPPYTEDATSEDSRAAALQYVRKVAGMRAPSRANTEAFDAAVAAVAKATDELLAQLVLAGHSTSGRATADSR
ncbi:DUF2277 domain-containing protein [Jatrophihabitans lederbergiae]|uniref:DUF2277 domain-containing protein n=1 Tax=Jatrophihabitans lederbergiae TaxID=3075547 RepID=A0ABU2J859_9ACTN|nr:DUF2277 domain-containing protein [Jatrophihabitans sp. DSM 44399]MDT0261165.1 DUF2277 domain-containing protein [Jatrophihabitans sp. DSM 44399]